MDNVVSESEKKIVVRWLVVNIFILLNKVIFYFLFNKFYGFF